MFNRFYLSLGAALLMSYAGVALTGHEFGAPDRQVVPADVRNSPGGYRSHHFWYSGYRGGK